MKFWNGLIGHKLLSGDMVSQMFSKQSGDGKDPKEKVFLNAFTGWIKEALKYTNIIVVLGNQ